MCVRVCVTCAHVHVYVCMGMTCVVCVYVCVYICVYMYYACVYVDGGRGGVTCMC